MANHGLDNMFIYVISERLKSLAGMREWCTESVNVFSGNFSYPADKALLVDVVLGLYAMMLRREHERAQAFQVQLHTAKHSSRLSRNRLRSKSSGSTKSVTVRSKKLQGDKPVAEIDELPWFSHRRSQKDISSNSHLWEGQSVSEPLSTLIAENKDQVFPTEFFGEGEDSLVAILEQLESSVDLETAPHPFRSMAAVGSDRPWSTPTPHTQVSVELSLVEASFCPPSHHSGNHPQHQPR